MAVPSRLKQIEAVTAYLERILDGEDDIAVSDVAKLIVDGMYDMWEAGLEDPPTPLHVGLAYKTPMVASKVYFVAWMGHESNEPDSRKVVWIIEPSSDHGCITTPDDPFWRIVIPSEDRRKDKTKPRPGSPGNNVAGWKEGDTVSLMQRTATYNILATGDKCVLMRDIKTGELQTDSNTNLEKFYKRERS